LNQEKNRQQELLYNAEYQIASMERTVSKAQAHKTMEEQKQLQADIDEKQRELNESQKQLEMLEKSNN
jgi:hypothetical protein